MNDLSNWLRFGKKLFARAKKDKNSKIREKAAIEKIDKVHQENLAVINENLHAKLEKLLDGQTSVGVTNHYGEIVVGKNAKFSSKVLKSIDFETVNPLNWTPDEKLWRGLRAIRVTEIGARYAQRRALAQLRREEGAKASMRYCTATAINNLMAIYVRWE